MLDRGADINAVTHVGTTALWQAAYHGELEEIRFLIGSGFDLKRHGGAGLQIAASRGHLEAVRLLVDENVDPNYQTFTEHPDKSDTPMHKAAMMGHADIIRYLLEQGADPTLKNHYGDRPYFVAKANKRTEIMALIASYEPQQLHDLDNRINELKRAKLPTAIIKNLREERIRVDLPQSRYLVYVEFCSLFEITEMQFEGLKLLNLLAETDAYGASGLLVWIPAKKMLGSYDIEHDQLALLHDVTWKSFFKSPGPVLDRILDGEYEYDVQTEA